MDTQKAFNDTYLIEYMGYYQDYEDYSYLLIKLESGLSLNQVVCHYFIENVGCDFLTKDYKGDKAAVFQSDSRCFKIARIIGVDKQSALNFLEKLFDYYEYDKNEVFEWLQYGGKAYSMNQLMNNKLAQERMSKGKN